MKLSGNGLALIKRFEGLRLKAYKCSAGVWTIGYGHTAHVSAGDEIDETQADRWLREDVAATEISVGRAVKAKINQDMFDALVSLTFNIGIGNFGKSTLLKCLNNGDYKEAAHEFSKWNKAAGKTNVGLVRRRALEQELFNEGLRKLRLGT